MVEEEANSAEAQLVSNKSSRLCLRAAESSTFISIQTLSYMVRITYLMNYIHIFAYLTSYSTNIVSAAIA